MLIAQNFYCVVLPEAGLLPIETWKSLLHLFFSLIARLKPCPTPFSLFKTGRLLLPYYLQYLLPIAYSPTFD